MLEYFLNRSIINFFSLNNTLSFSVFSNTTNSKDQKRYVKNNSCNNNDYGNRGKIHLKVLSI